MIESHQIKNQMIQTYTLEREREREREQTNTMINLLTIGTRGGGMRLTRSQQRQQHEWSRVATIGMGLM